MIRTRSGPRRWSIGGSTDQGSQFTGAVFTGLLKGHGIRFSFHVQGAWRDNVFFERLWKSVKYEEVYLKVCSPALEARKSFGRYLVSTTVVNHIRALTESHLTGSSFKSLPEPKVALPCQIPLIERA